KPRRVATARWMKRWLLKQDEAVDEPDFPIATDAELRCTRTGQVLSDFHGQSVFDLNAERARALRAARETAGPQRSMEGFRAEMKTRIGLDERRIATAKPRVVAAVARPGYTIRKLIFDVEPGIVLPALDIATGQPDPAGPVVVQVGVDWIRDLATDRALDEL